MRIAAYTICLNELQHCERWAESVKDADYRIVLDTGSTDGTVEKLRELGVTVYEQKITPWRFDVARNAALSMVPLDADVCISLDMDEFMEQGYRAEIEKVWKANTTRLSYIYVFDYKPGADSQNGFHIDKIHARQGYEWRRPVHETVFAQDPSSEVVASNPKVVMNQIQDRSKPTRGNYLPLMKIAHDEDRNDSQIAFWYGRELMWAKDNSEATVVLERYLCTPTAKWDAERSEALIYLSRMNPDRSWEYLMRATAEAPSRREVWLEVANHSYSKQDWINLMWAASNGLERSQSQDSYLDKAESWGPHLADLGSLAAWNLGWKEKAIDLCKKALALSPNDERLNNNLRYMTGDNK
jgi:tetratricopeptide (TPR) repeat protein